MDERWTRARKTRHTAEAWFFSFPSVASSKADRSEYDNLFRGKGLHRKRPFPTETPLGPEVGISLRALTLLPDEKELNSQLPVVVPLAVENALAGIFAKFVEAFPKKFGLVLFDLNSINPHPLVEVRQVAEVFPENRVRL